MDEPVRHERAGHIGDQLPAPLHRHMLENHQVDGQDTQPRPDRQDRIRHARRAGRGLRPAAGALRLVQVVLHLLRRRGRDLLLPERSRDAQVFRVRQVTAAEVPAVPGPRTLRRLTLVAQASDHRFQRRDLLRLRREPPLLFPDPLRLLPGQRVTRVCGRFSRRRSDHSPQSSPKPRPDTPAMPHPTLNATSDH